MQNFRKMRKISLILLYSSLGLSFLMMFLSSCGIIVPSFFLFIGFPLIILYILLSVAFWRCPKCDKGFEVRHSKMDKMEYCPYCGVKIK